MRVGLLLLLATVGCASKAEQTPAPTSAADGLKELGEVYRYLAHEKQPPPAQVDDLAPYADSLPSALPRIQSGEYVVYWKVSFSDKLGEKDAILAHVKEAATQGGLVLLRDGTVKEMTAPEFQGAHKGQ